MAPQPFSRRFPRDNQVDDPGYPQSWGDKIETSDPPSRKSSQTRSLVPRGATTLGTPRLVTGLVTVNGNSRPANSENTKRRTPFNHTVRWKLHHDTRKQNYL